MLTEKSIVQAAKNNVSSNLDNEIVILNLQDGAYYGLNPVGARIWELIQQSLSIEAIRDHLLQEYEVSPEQCERELIALLDELQSQGLIDVQNSTA